MKAKDTEALVLPRRRLGQKPLSWRPGFSAKKEFNDFCVLYRPTLQDQDKLNPLKSGNLRTDLCECLRPITHQLITEGSLVCSMTTSVFEWLFLVCFDVIADPKPKAIGSNHRGQQNDPYVSRAKKVFRKALKDMEGLQQEAKEKPWLTKEYIQDLNSAVARIHSTEGNLVNQVTEAKISRIDGPMAYHFIEQTIGADRANDVLNCVFERLMDAGFDVALTKKAWKDMAAKRRARAFSV